MADSSSNTNGNNANGFANGGGSVNGAPSVVARGDSPAVAELTAPSMRTRRAPTSSDVRQVEGVSLADMALPDEDQTCSPVRRIKLTPEEE